MSERIRREYHLETVRSSMESDYVPQELRDPREVEFFSGKPRGIRVAWQQHAGLEAMERAFNGIYENGDEKDIESVANVLGVGALGTAFHTVGQGTASKLMYYKVQLPRMVHENGQRLSHEQLADKIGRGLARASTSAFEILERTDGGVPTKRQGEKLGRLLSVTALELAALADGVADFPWTDEAGLQTQAYLSAARMREEASQITGRAGVRPSVAQLADEHSPYRHYMRDVRTFATDPVLAVINDSVKTSFNNALN